MLLTLKNLRGLDSYSVSASGMLHRIFDEIHKDLGKAATIYHNPGERAWNIIDQLYMCYLGGR